MELPQTKKKYCENNELMIDLTTDFFLTGTSNSNIKLFLESYYLLNENLNAINTPYDSYDWYLRAEKLQNSKSSRILSN